MFVVTSVVVSRARGPLAAAGARGGAARRDRDLAARARDRRARELERISAEAARALQVERARITLGDRAAPSGYALDGRRAARRDDPRSKGGSAATRARAGALLPALASLLGVAIDRERLAREALEAEALRRADAIKTALLRAVSHDLRTPLMAISTSAGALARPDLAIDDADRAELLATILAASDRLDHLVGNLLDLSRLQAGAAEPEPELVELDELVVGRSTSSARTAERVEVTLPGRVARGRASTPTRSSACS